MRNIKQQVDTNSADFKQGVEAGLNSAEDTKNWQAGNELGQELKEGANKETVSESLFKVPSPPFFMRFSPEGNKGNAQDENKEPVSESLFKEPSPPLFLIHSSEGKKGNAQDEKDETEE